MSANHDESEQTMTRGTENAGRPPAGGECSKRVHSRTLMGQARKLVIEHEGTEYVLRITAQNKLILTK